MIVITKEQVEDFKEFLEINDFCVAENIKEALEDYEKSKWRCFNKNDTSTYPTLEKIVLVSGCDYLGEWTWLAVLKKYKKTQNKKQWGYRWLDIHGNKLEDQAIEKWRNIDD